jgi:Ca-activated chloride channel family protein
MKDRLNPNQTLRLKDHEVSVVLNNGFSRTQVTQIFSNQGERVVEGIYSFPLPKQSSLSEVSLLIGERELLGEVVEKKKAREVYEEEKAQGRDTALAEKNDYKSYEVSVGNIRPGEDVTLRLVYYQPLEIDLNIGRYVYPLAEGNTDDAKIPFWSIDDQVQGRFRFNLELKSAFPVKDVRVPGFEGVARIEGVNSSPDPDEEQNHNKPIRVDLEVAEGASLSKDVVFYYRLDDQVPARVEMITYREDPKSEGTLMLVVTPAADLKPITRGSDWQFVLDVSGSMSGHKIRTLGDGVGKVLKQMNPADRFRIVTFNNSAQDLTNGYVTASPENIGAWLEQIRNLNANGGTNLFAGLKEVYGELDEDRTTGVILVTDGVANVGPTGHDRFLKLLQEQDIRLFTFVIGNGANQPLLDRLATDSNGFAMNISDSDDITGRLLQAKAKVMHEALHDVHIKVLGEKIREVTPAKPKSLYVGQQWVQFGKFRGEGPVTLEMKAKISGQEKTWTIQVDLPEVNQDHPELERLWALSTIDEVMEEVREKGETEALRKQIVNLGTAYSLVTDYTSMLVVEEETYEAKGIQRRNAERVDRERLAQARQQAQPAANHRVDQGKTFQQKSAPSIRSTNTGGGGGSGPVGPLFLLLVAGLKKLQSSKSGRES